jgi:CheY-like chemotaxis protein
METYPVNLNGHRLFILLQIIQSLKKYTVTKICHQTTPRGAVIVVFSRTTYTSGCQLLRIEVSFLHLPNSLMMIEASDVNERRPRIVLIEDDPAISDVLTILFERNGFDAVSYTDGSLIISNQSASGDLFLIDKQLSGVDGLEICRHLKQDPVTSGIPVIVFSASPYVEQMATAAGADLFIEKPFSSRALMDAIQSVMKKRH